jgi:ribosomal protein S18 acetylase RimI-like enzyme
VSDLPYRVRRLTHADLPDFRALRLEALLLHPEAFGSSFEEESGLELAGFAPMVPEQPPGATFGGFLDDGLVGIAALFVAPRLKQRHKGTIVGVYVASAHRGTGLARQLLEAVIGAARQAGLAFVHLTATVGNEPARRLYLGLGFRPYGLERRSLHVAGRMYDVELMALDLD